jgi:hypothetical protein
MGLGHQINMFLKAYTIKSVLYMRKWFSNFLTSLQGRLSEQLLESQGLSESRYKLPEVGN